MLIVVRLRHEYFHVPSHQIFSSVSEQPLRRRIHRFDHALFVNSDDRIHRRFQDGSGPGIAVLQPANRSPQIGYVAGDPREHPPIAQRKLADGKMHGEHRAVLSQAGNLAADANDLLVAGCKVVVRKY